MEEKRVNKKITFSIITPIILLLVIIGVTFAYFMAFGGADEKTVKTSNLSINYSEGTIINATNNVTVNDINIKTDATELPFSVTNTSTRDLNLEISLTEITMSETLKNIDFRWGLYNADTNNGLSYGTFEDIGSKTNIIIYQDTIISASDPDITKNYILRVWIHDNGGDQSVMQGTTFKGKLKVTGTAVEYTPEKCFTMDNNIITGYSDTCPKDVIIPKTINGKTVEYIESGFYSKKITSLIIPDTLKAISPNNTEDAFGGNLLTHLTIPESVNYIGPYAFEMNQLETITIPDTTNIYNTGVFENNKLSSIVINSDLMNGTFSANKLKNVILMDGITKFTSEDGYSVFGINELTSIEIPSSVTTIESYTFSNNPYLTEIIVRGKNSLDEFDDAAGLTSMGGLSSSVNIIFRP